MIVEQSLRQHLSKKTANYVMNIKKNAPILTPTNVLKLIEDFRNAEMCRDVELMRTAIEPIWKDFDSVPSFGSYQNPVRAELLRNAGVFLSLYGQAKNKKDYQAKGKDLLTRAIEDFESVNLTDKAAEVKVMLAFCYWNSGEVEESEAILKMVEVEFGENSLHPVYFQIRINRLLMLIWKRDFQVALEVVENINFSMEFCPNLRHRAMFHNEAGLVFRYIKKYDESILHHKEAIRVSEQTGNQLFVACNLNNLALVYEEIKEYDEAIRSINLSIDKFFKMNHRGLLPHALDTKALIYLDTERFDLALDVINQAIEIFREGEDAAGLTEALWTQVRCLLRLEQKEEALTVFVELQEIARMRIGETAVQKFTRSFSDEIYALKHFPLTGEIQQFKKERVQTAIVQAKGKISKAASLLGLKNHQALSDILNNQFPTLYQELGFRRRARRKQQNGDGESRTVTVSSEDILTEAEISQLALPDKHFSFDFPCRVEEFKTFYFDRFLMEKFEIESGAVVAVVQVAKIKAGMLLLISDEESFRLATAEYDRWTNVFFISDEKGEPHPLNAEQVIGEPVGYCLIERADNKFIEFSRLVL